MRRRNIEGFYTRRRGRKHGEYVRLRVGAASFLTTRLGACVLSLLLRDGLSALFASRVAGRARVAALTPGLAG